MIIFLPASTLMGCKCHILLLHNRCSRRVGCVIQILHPGTPVLGGPYPDELPAQLSEHYFLGKVHSMYLFYGINCFG